MRILIKHQYLDNKYSIIEKVNDQLRQNGFNVQFELAPYDDNRVYRTEERARDVRIDCMPMLG